METVGEVEVGEERVARRQRVLLHGNIAFMEQFAAIPCTVRDLSETGARLVIEAPMAVPDRFTLHVEVRGFKVDCERVWSKGLMMGVRFTGPKAPSRLAREQFLQSSDNALSPDTIRQMRLREEREALPASRPDDALKAGQVRRPAPVSFGRR